MTPDIGTRTSGQLVEVRTVLSRAENALGLHGDWTAGPQQAEQWLSQDLDGEAIVRDLKAVVELLSKYRRTGRAKKS